MKGSVEGSTFLDPRNRQTLHHSIYQESMEIIFRTPIFNFFYHRQCMRDTLLLCQNHHFFKLGFLVFFHNLFCILLGFSYFGYRRSYTSFFFFKFRDRVADQRNSFRFGPSAFKLLFCLKHFRAQIFKFLFRSGKFKPF